MNATTASATTAPTTNNTTVCIGFWVRGRRNTSVFRHDLKTARTYARKKAREGYVIGSVYVWTDSDGTKCANVHLIPRTHYSIITPGYQEWEIINHRDGSKFAIMAYEVRDCLGDVFIYRECADIPAPTPEPVQYGVRTIVNGVIEDWTRYDTELDARDNAQTIVDSDITGNTHATIIPIMPDGTLGGVLDVIRYEPPTENTDWMFPDDDEPEPTPINAIEECAKYCPTAQDAVKVAMLLNPSIRVVSNRSIAEIVVDENEIHARTRPNNQYVKGWCDLGVVSIELRNEGLLIWYVDEFDNATRDYFIPWDVVQTVTVLNTGRDIFKSVKGAN